MICGLVPTALPQASDQQKQHGLALRARELICAQTKDGDDHPRGGLALAGRAVSQPQTVAAPWSTADTC